MIKSAMRETVYAKESRLFKKLEKKTMLLVHIIKSAVRETDNVTTFF